MINANVTDQTIIRIAQGGFYCKGYEAGSFDGIWGTGLQGAIEDLQEDLGITKTGSMNQNLFKSLLTTDPTVLTSSGTSSIRTVQKYLNGTYAYLFLSKLGYIPTGGYYERKTSKALIYAFQKEIGTTADGALGPATFGKMPSISAGSTQTALVKLLQAALICNGFNTDFDSVYGSGLTATVSAFQQFMCLQNDSLVILGSVNRRTWGALLWSKGDTDRTPNACDCRTKILDLNVANELYNRGFRYIGRYLSNVEGGADKALTTAEIQILLTAGLKIFPIFQESEHIPVPTDFTKATGKTDAAKALKAALALGIKQGTTIYFAVDCDMMEDQVMGYALPYFEGIHEVLDNSEYYKVGVYGARNTCIKVRAAYPGTNCFVANMSSGYSGNLGYRMPDNWLFEQYIEKKNYAIAGTSFDLDYDIASDSAEGITAVDINSNLDDYVPPFNPSVDGLMTEKPTIRILDLLPAITWLEERYYDLYDITNPTDAQKRVCSQAVCDFLFQYVYNDLKWQYVAPKNDHFINYINVHYANNPNYVALYPYIYATVNEDGEEPQTIRPQLVKDGHLGLFELPHLAIVIKCYMQSPVPGEWSAWAGDFATGVQETCTMGQTVGFLNLAKDRLGDYEPDVAIPATSRQFNYYDIIADLDGYAIRELIRTIPSLSGCIQEYYSNLARYDKRYQYFKDILGFDKWDVADICVTILDYFYADSNLWLRNLFAPDYDEYSGAVEATATIFAHNIIYWAEYTDVSMT